MSGKESAKICRVCGDKALARNFCAVSCESCKAFFRRNASKIEEMKCIYGNDCEINFDTRKRCRKCRLKKCFKIGMRKEWILNDDEKRVRNNKIKEKRQMKRLCDTKFETNCFLSEDAFTSNSESNVSEKSSVDSQKSHQMIEVFRRDQINDNFDNLNKLSAEYVTIFRPLTDYRNNFTETESNVFTELLNATKFLTILVPKGISYEIKTYLEALHWIGLKFDQETRKQIRTIKTLRAFKSICKNDQVNLLKYGSIQIAFLRSVTAYENQTETWNLSLGENKSTLLKQITFQQKSVENYMKCKLLMAKIVDIWDQDQIILHLLMAIILFNPNRPKLIHKSNVRLQQQIYMHLLQRYLLIKYQSESESKRRFLKLMETVIDLHNFDEQYIRHNFDEISEKIHFFSNSPLLQELYDEKPLNC